MQHSWALWRDIICMHTVSTNVFPCSEAEISRRRFHLHGSLLRTQVPFHYATSDGTSYTIKSSRTTSSSVPAIKKTEVDSFGVYCKLADQNIRNATDLAGCSLQVGIPYVRSKLQDLYERLGGGLDTEMMELQGEDRDNIYRVSSFPFCLSTSSLTPFAEDHTPTQNSHPPREILQDPLPVLESRVRAHDGRLRYLVCVWPDEMVEMVDGASRD
jgi:hypothetical protein